MRLVWTTPDPYGRTRKGLGITLPGSVLSAGMLLSVLMRAHQLTRVQVPLMTGSEYAI